MKRLGTILVLLGSAALVWCATVLGGAALFDRYERWRLGRAPAIERSAPAVSPAPASPSPHSVIGRLEIPRLHLSTVVIEGDDDASLLYGAGHIPGTALPYASGNVGIAAHRDTLFRPLRHIAKNDRITLTTPEGVFDYTVESTEIVHPDAVDVLKDSQAPELTLVTCYPFYFVGPAPLRFVVHARRAG